jgi:hypothetical protein
VRRWMPCALSEGTLTGVPLRIFSR